MYNLPVLQLQKPFKTKNELSRYQIKWQPAAVFKILEILKFEK
jgi:hypothetical protein